MLRLAVIFLVIALIAAFLGFGGVASMSWAGAKILFLIFLVLAVLSALGSWSEEGPSDRNCDAGLRPPLASRRAVGGGKANVQV